MRQYPLERLIKNIGTNNKTVAALLQPRFCAYKKAVIAVRVSGGHLCDAEAPTEPAGETAVRRAAIRFPSPSSLRSRVSGCGNPFSLLRKGFFALHPKSSLFSGVIIRRNYLLYIASYIGLVVIHNLFHFFKYAEKFFFVKLYRLSYMYKAVFGIL